MENERNIDLQKFAPKRASKWYLVRILLYTIFLVFLGYLVVSQLNKFADQEVQVEEIEGITIEME
jgi:hypothetical protein